MSNDNNTSESTKQAQQNQPAQTNVTGSRGGAKVISVQGNDINKVVNAETGGQIPYRNPPPSGNQAPPKQSGGGPEGAAKVSPAIQDAVQPKQGIAAVAPGQTQPASGTEAPDVDDVDIEGMISTSEQEVQTIDKDVEERKKKQEYLTQAIDSLSHFERLIYNNSETGEVIGTKMRYVADHTGKTIYDYMNDPVVTEHLAFKVSDNDPKDGSPIDKQISFYWIKPTF